MSQQEVLTAQEVADLLRISLWSVYDMTRRGLIPHFCIGRCKRYLKSDVMAWAAGPKVDRLAR